MNEISANARLALKRQLAQRVQTTITASAVEDYQLVVKHAVNRIPDKGRSRASQRARAEFKRDLLTLQQDIASEALYAIKRDFATRGLPLPEDAALTRQAQIAAKKTLRNADDLVNTLTKSYKDVEGTFSIEVLTGQDHAKRVVESLVRSTQDEVEQKLYEQFTKKGTLTGRRRWRVVDPKKSRRPSMDGTIAEKDVDFFDTFSRKFVPGPRSNAKDVASASGSTSYLEYETTDGRWI